MKKSIGICIILVLLAFSSAYASKDYSYMTLAEREAEYQKEQKLSDEMHQAEIRQLEHSANYRLMTLVPISCALSSALTLLITFVIMTIKKKDKTVDKNQQEKDEEHYRKFRAKGNATYIK